MANIKIQGLIVGITNETTIDSDDTRSRIIFLKEPAAYDEDGKMYKKAITYQIHVYNKRCDLFNDVVVGSRVEVEAYLESRMPNSFENISNYRIELAQLIQDKNYEAYNCRLQELKAKNDQFFSDNNKSRHIKLYPKLNLKSIYVYGNVQESILQQEILSSNLSVDDVSEINLQKRKPNYRSAIRHGQPAKRQQVR